MNKRSSQGFTLIEIMIIMVIVGIGLGIGISGYITQVREAQLKRDTARVVDDIDRVRQLTIARDVKGQDCQTNDYSMVFTKNTNRYRVIQNCDLVQTDISEMALNSLIFDSTTPSQLTFTYPYGDAAAAQTIVLKHTKLNKCITLSVPVSGLLSVSELETCP